MRLFIMNLLLLIPIANTMAAEKQQDSILKAAKEEIENIQNFPDPQGSLQLQIDLLEKQIIHLKSIDPHLVRQHLITKQYALAIKKKALNLLRSKL